MDTLIYPPRELIEADRPPRASSLLSKTYRERLVERGMLALYRWYTSRSQETRNWNPDLGFEWQHMNQNFSATTQQVLKGFFAVEQYVPDYVSKALDMVRRSHGRSHFQIRWGSEEEKHADTWENAVLFSKSQTPDQLAEYKYQLRKKEWELPWEDPLHLLLYTVFQERATQLNYINIGKIATGQKAGFESDKCDVLAKVALTIATDEAAHYNFFLEAARLHMYYFPLETLEAIRDVVEHFAMPAQRLLPDWKEFFEAAYKAGVYGPREYARDVVAVGFKQFGIESRKSLESGILKTRMVPDEEGQMRCSAIWETFDPDAIVEDVKRLYAKVQGYESKYGMSEIDPTHFVENPLWKAS
jgi:acyl-[acyl-carrier-protein] desaturase